MESPKIWEMRKRNLSAVQKEFLVGTILGDGYLLRTTRGYCLRIHHSIKQKDYVDWKYEIMENLVNTSPKTCHNGYYFRTVSNSIFDEYRKMFYERNRKKIPGNIGDLLTSFGLAVWIMDDGSRDRGCMRISTHSFNYVEHLELQETLKAKFGIKCNIQKAGDKFWLWITHQSIRRVVKLVKPHFIPSMLYKLPPND